MSFQSPPATSYSSLKPAIQRACNGDSPNTRHKRFRAVIQKNFKKTYPNSNPFVLLCTSKYF